MIIDGHAHAAGVYSSAESISAVTEQYHIDKVLLCTGIKNNQGVSSPPSLPLKKSPDSNYVLNRMLRFAYNHFIKDCGDGNRFTADLARQVPDKVIPFLWVNPLDRKHMDSVERHLDEYRARGIKLHQAWDPFAIGDAQFNELIEIAQHRGLPVFIHIYSKAEAAKLLRFAKDHPDVVFIAAHLAGASLFRQEGAKLRNVFFDTSGSERVQGQDILDAVRAFGYDHVVFGTDTPYADIGVQIAKIDGLPLTDAEKEHVMGWNLQNLLGIEA